MTIHQTVVDSGPFAIDTGPFAIDTGSLPDAAPPDRETVDLAPPPPACVPESDAVFCSRLGKACGGFTASDNCGVSRTVTACGSCAAPQTCGGSGSANICGAAPVIPAGCSFTIVKNVYDPSMWWGTVSFKNNGPATSSSFKLSFSVPSGVLCDYTDGGWTVKQTGAVCAYTKPGTMLAAGASLSMNYSTNSQSLSAPPADTTVTDANCK